MSLIITRIWHGTTHADHADTYLQYLDRTGIAGYKSTPGNLAVEIWRRIEDQVCHFWTVTKWDSVESIKQFAGEQYQLAKYYPEDEHYLLEFEKTVQHMETFIY